MERWTCDREVAGSTPAAALFGQQPWASCSHLMCLCSPSSIIWYLARAFMLIRRNVAAGIGFNEQGEYCRAALQRSDRKEPRYKWPTLLLLYPLSVRHCTHPLTSLKRCSHCARHRCRCVVRCRVQCEHRTLLQLKRN